MTASVAGAIRGHGRTASEIYALVKPGGRLTEEQVAVIEAPAEPTLVVAGAGSGKTEALSLRLVYLIDHGERLFGRDIAPDEVLALTFTRKAAAEIADRTVRRLDEAFGRDPHRALPTVSTYHAYAAGLIAEHGLRVGVDPDSVVLTDAALWQLAARVAEAWDGDVDFDGALSTAASAIVRLSASLADNAVTPAEFREFLSALGDRIAGLPLGARQTKASKGADLAAPFRARAALTPVIERFAEAKSAGSFLDFADQIAIGNRLAELPGVGEVERAAHRAVLLDEFQDTSPGQLALFGGMYGSSHPVMAVGDPHQAIYGFRGASEDALAAFVDRFGGEAVHRRALLVSFRNSSEILAVANGARRALDAHSRVSVRELRTRFDHLDEPEPAQEAPGVEAVIYEDAESEARAVVEWVVARRAALQATRRGLTPVDAAILCRTRSAFGPIVAALTEAGVDHQVVGIGGLVDRPAVADLLALLEVSHDPSRGDSLMRLVTGERLRLGVADIAALHQWAEHRAGPRDERADGRAGEASLVDALDDLPAPGWVSRDGYRLGDEARVRLEALAATVSTIRSHTYLRLPELLPFAARAWGLDVEARLSAREDGRGEGDEDLDGLTEASRTFASGVAHATLGGFLAWIDAARTEERGLEAPTGSLRRASVQVMTIHGAKGMEWDVVAVPGLADGVFPHVDVSGALHSPVYRDSGWLADVSALPWPLRRDRGALPEWRIQGATDLKDVEASMLEFREEAGRRAVDVDERRLFYVAVTRAKTDLFLTGSWLGEGTKARPVSLYLRESVAAGLVDDSAWAATPQSGVGDQPERAVDTAGDDEAAPRPRVRWPVAETARARARRELGAEVGAALMAGGPVPAGYPHEAEIEAMLADVGRHTHESSWSLAPVPARLTTTDMVALARDPAAFALDVLRPIPAEPRPAAGRGSDFHAWVERHFRRPALLDPDDWSADTGTEAPIDDLAATRAAFISGPWAERRPEAVEAYVEVPFGAVMVRCRIDAVFPPGGGLEKTTVVDWKTGGPPTSEVAIRGRDIQLAVYRVAWAAFKGLSPDEIDGVFVYVETGETVRPASPIGLGELVTLLGSGAPRSDS